MKIFYTKQFKDDLKNETKNLYLGYYGLRHGNFKRQLESKNLVMGIQSSPLSGYYVAQGLDYLESGIQLSIDVPSNDNSFYYTEGGVGKDTSYYQLIIFYYTDLTSPISDNIQVAFILFEDFNNDTLNFENLNLVTRKNIITIPSLPDRKCTLTFAQSDLTEFLEGETIHIKTLFRGSSDSYASREYIEKKLDEDYREDSNRKAKYYRTSLINKYGLKLY
jgi:hypothetical protein